MFNVQALFKKKSPDLGTIGGKRYKQVQCTTQLVPVSGSTAVTGLSAQENAPRIQRLNRGSRYPVAKVLGELVPKRFLCISCVAG